MTETITHGSPAGRLSPPTPATAAFVGGARLQRRSSIAALVPHYRCEQWLGNCLESLLRQTQSLDAIVVIDDGSGVPPVEVVRHYPEVTLLASAVNVGPYALVQQVIADTAYDGYLFQDADDWSAPERLAVLLDEAERSGAELVGCQEVLIDCDTSEARVVCYPVDVNQAVAERPGSFALAHHTGIVSRDLILRIGGFATGLRVGADSELLPRTVRAGVVRNVSQCCYFRRRRGGSLTTGQDTGMESALRARVAELLGARREADHATAARGEVPATRPVAVGAPVRLEHVLGPHLRAPGRSRGTASIDTASMAVAGIARQP